MKARADQGSFGEGWTDDRICQALETNQTMVARVRRQLVEQGVTAVLTRKKRKTPPIQPNRLLADKVVELKIVERAHFNTVGRALKKTIQAASKQILGHPAEIERGFRGRERCSGGLYPPS